MTERTISKIFWGFGNRMSASLNLETMISETKFIEGYFM